MKWISYLHRTHFCTFLFLKREFTREFSQRARALNSADSSECLWLVIAFICSTESSVIGYIQSCIRAWLWLSASERRFEFSSEWFEALNVLIIQRDCIKYNTYHSAIFCLLETGPPPNTKRRQNSLNRLCSVCAVKKLFVLLCFFRY